MKLWVTRQRDGNFMLTAMRPSIARVGRIGEEDAYIQPGEPIGVRHLCKEGIATLCDGIPDVSELVPLESVKVEIVASRCDG